METRFLEVYKQLEEGTTKYVYYLLTAAASGIALSVNATSGSALSWSQIPLGLAVLSWGVSFFFGCRCAYTRNVLFGSNSDTAARIMKSNRVTQVLRESVTKDLKTANRKAAKFMRWQFATLIAGAVLYVVWHVIEMALRSHGA